MRRLQYVLAAFMVIVVTAPVCAQRTGTIRGRVTAENAPQGLVGVLVTFGNRNAYTREDGTYLLTAVQPGADTLRARIVGYAPAKRAITVAAGQTVVGDFALAAVAVKLSELVSTGYGTQRAGSVTGAVTKVSAEEFNTGRIISAEQLIESKVAGAQVIDNNEPGGGMSIRIRGATSINASSDPLYVVDGLPIGTNGGLATSGRDALNFLNPNDIENITVLKGGEAASIYGANAANGVVIIQTKAGRPGTTQIDYTSSVSASQVTRLPSMLSAAQFAAAVQQHAASNASQLMNASTDWFSQVDRTGIGQDQNLSVSGAGQSNAYRLSLGFLKQEGIIKASSTERVSLGLNYSQKLFSDRLDVNTNLRGSRSLDHFAPGGVLSNAAQMGPTQPVTDPTSTTGFYNWPGNSLQSADNPAQILALATDKATTYRSIGNVTARYRMPFLEALTANANLGYDVTEVDRSTFNPATLHAQLKAGTGGTLFTTTPSLFSPLLETYLNYQSSVSVVPGSFDLTGGYSYSSSHGEYPSLNESNLSTSLLGSNGIAAAQTVRNNLDIQDSRLISFFGRVNYNLNDRYLASFSLRRDGSSRFGPDNAWGNFPAVAVAWRVSEEPFMSKHSSISDLKVRASWGLTGNQQFANYQQYAAYTVGDAQSQVQFGNTFVSTIRPAAVDPNIKWEQTKSYDLGLDWGIKAQRFSGSIDWYNKSTSDLIFTVPVAAGSNFSNFLTTNIGSMKNSGVEAAVEARVIDGGRGGLTWATNFNAAHNTNQLTSINPVGGAQKILTGGIAGGVGTTIEVLQPGKPINSFYVYKQTYDASGKAVDGKCACADSLLNPFHDPAPKWILGHTSLLTYGRWDAAFTLRAWLGNYVYNNVASNLGSYAELTRGSPYNLHASVLTTGFNQPHYQSSYYVEDGSFLRMDNVTLGYAFQYRDRPLRLYGTLQNAFTITGYSGVDPTAGLNGIDNNIYPRARTWTGGMSIRF